MIFVIIIGLIRPTTGWAADDTLTRKQIREFLLNAEVISSRHTGDIKHPWRLTLSNGAITHDASFQTADERNKTSKHNLKNKTYRYNIAASELAEMLGLDDALPVYVEREWHGRLGSISWWLPVQMAEAERLKKKILPPDLQAWNKQIDRIRVFDALVDEPNDPNDVLIGDDWKVYRVDFSRGFLLEQELSNPEDLVRCDRNLFEKIVELNSQRLERRTRGYLNKSEVQAIMARRDKVVEHFRKLIADKGESAILY